MGEQTTKDTVDLVNALLAPNVKALEKGVESIENLVNRLLEQVTEFRKKMESFERRLAKLEEKVETALESGSVERPKKKALKDLTVADVPWPWVIAMVPMSVLLLLVAIVLIALVPGAPELLIELLRMVGGKP